MTRVAAPAKIGTMTFTGFPDAAFEFYEGLEADNPRAYWQDHKAIYETAVKGPLTALLAELEPEFGQAGGLPPHRDVRFSAMTRVPTRPSKAFGTDVGWPATTSRSMPTDCSPGRLPSPRHGPDQADARGGRLRPVPSSSAWSSTRAAGFEIAGEQVAATPRGFARDHPRIELLRHRS